MEIVVFDGIDLGVIFFWVVLIIVMQTAQLLLFFFKVVDDIVHKVVDIHISVAPFKVVDVVGLSYLEQLVDDVW